MTPGVLNLVLYRGTTFAQTFICQDDSHVAVNLTGWTAHALVRTDPQKHIVLDLNPVITNGPAGTVSISFTDEETVLLAPGEFVWDLVLERPSGERLGPFLAGTFIISTAITRV